VALPDAPGRPAKEPRAYFLTFTCYGVRLHGDSRSSVDRKRPSPLGRYSPENLRLVRHERRVITQEPASLTAPERETVLSEIRRSCELEGWRLHAAHVRSTHVHVVVTAPAPPESVTRELKAYATRALNQRFGRKDKRWARHGSMMWLWDDVKLHGAVRYVVQEQGAPMALYAHPSFEG
jgi:REP element-mobilizing transposase RayT